MTNRQHHVIHEETIDAIRIPEERQERFPYTAQNWIRAGHRGLVVQVLDARRIGIVRDSAQRRPWKVEMHRMKRAVQVEFGCRLTS